jgi:lipid-A-disaccharide synthase-like uncharacterized protein
MLALLLKWLPIGFVGGSLFGVLFGIIASIFRNGPPVMQAIAESWWWFALMGSFIGVGQALAFRQDALGKNRQ